MLKNHLITKLNKTHIRNIMTIRYDPTEKPPLQPVMSASLNPIHSDINGYNTERLLKNTISKSLRQFDESLVISLSSGIDSTLSLALIRKVFPKHKITAICGIFGGDQNESKQAKKIAKAFDADFKEVQMSSIFKHMPQIISISKKPRWNTYTHLIAKEAKKYGDVIVTGDGADEVFGGYTFRYAKFLNLLHPKDNWKTKTINYLECHNRDWVPDQEQLFDKSMKFNWDSIYRYFRPYFSNRLKPLQQIMLADFNGKLLHDFIPTGKAICQHYKLIGYSAFLDYFVINYGLALPTDQKYNQKTQLGKLTLRKIAKRIGVEHIQQKKGFSPDLWFDWKNYGKKICETYLLNRDSKIYREKIINPNWVVRTFEKVNDDGDIRYLNRLISVLALEIWYNIFITKDMMGDEIL